MAQVKDAGPRLGFSFSGRDGTGKAVVGLAAGPLASHADVLTYFQWDAPAMWPVRTILHPCNDCTCLYYSPKA
jgi:hypothetical protein